MSKTLYDKLFDAHLVAVNEDNTALLYIDRHLMHEVTSPQAFAGLKAAGRQVRRPDLTWATMDHNVPTDSRDIDASGEVAAIQMKRLQVNCDENNIPVYDLNHPYQGIVHVIGPELGITLPGTTVVCGDSHTATHGAFGALAFGIGTSEIEHVLATQTLKQSKSKNLKIELTGKPPAHITGKDIVLAIIGKIGCAGGTGYVAEFCGETIAYLSMEARMSICNMAIEFGARAGLIAPDNVTFDYLKGRKFSPKNEQWDEAVSYWKTLKSDTNAHFDKSVQLDVSELKPQVTWGTNPGQVTSVDGQVPDPKAIEDLNLRASVEQALAYMGLEPLQKITAIQIDKVFIGSCTNSRLEDLQSAAKIAKGKQVAKNVQAYVVPGSMQVKKEAESLGLDVIFKTAGFQWREPGCSMCLAMNNDKLEPFERCASTSNRNFEGRQGRNGRTHLVSPAMAAAAAIAGHFVDIIE